MSNVEKCNDAARSRALVDEYYSDPARRPSFVRDMFNRSAQHYNLVNQIFSFGSGAWYRRTCLQKAGVRPGVRVVDVAAGTGLLAREAVALTGDSSAVIGVDISEAMLAIAQRNVGIPLLQATAEALPLAPDIADFVTMGYALRHVADLDGALNEAMRILLPGGSLVLLEISAPRKRLYRVLAAGFIGFILPLLSLLMTRDGRARTLMRYHWQTIAAYMPPDVVMRVMAASGFTNVACSSEFDLFHLYTGQKPKAQA